MRLSSAPFVARSKLSIVLPAPLPGGVHERTTATAIVREALAGTGVELVASCSAEIYDERAPDAFRSPGWLPGARGLVVAGSSGPLLWDQFRAHVGAAVGDGLGWSARREANALDAFVSGLLDGADRALEAAGVRFLRFEAAFQAVPRVDFLALGRMVGLGSPGPFGMLIHPIHGPWWALRGAWLVDADVDGPLDPRPPCVGCAAPCIGGWEHAGGVSLATPEARVRCVVGQASRYDDAQIAYHYPGQGVPRPKG